MMLALHGMSKVTWPSVRLKPFARGGTWGARTTQGELDSEPVVHTVCKVV